MKAAWHSELLRRRRRPRSAEPNGSATSDFLAPDGVLLTDGQQATSQLQVPRLLGRIGHGKVAAARFLHPSGFREVMVHNTADLEAIDPETEAARVGARSADASESTFTHEPMNSVFVC